MSTAEKSVAPADIEGLIQGGGAACIFALAQLPRRTTNQGHCSPVIEGERMQISLITKTRGERARKPHTHPNEQWNYIVQGKLRVKVGDQPEQLCGPGTLLYFPANVVHSTAATPEEDVVFLAIKDRSNGMFNNTAAEDR
jgi:quercetin dioxygenase-like cupin family protein